MRATVDAVGRIVVPKPLRDLLGLHPGSAVEISRYGSGLSLVPVACTARVLEEETVLVAAGEAPIDDETVFGLLGAGRR